MPKLNNLTIRRVILQPSAGEHSILHNQFIWRTEKRFVGENEIAIADIQEPIWWNRPYTSNTFCKKKKTACTVIIFHYIVVRILLRLNIISY